MVKQTGIDDQKDAEVYGLSGNRFQKGEEWMRFLIWKDEDTVIAKSVTNAICFLTHHHAVEGVFIYNEFSDEIVLGRCPPWRNDKDKFEPMQRMHDHDITHATAWLERVGVTTSINTTRSAIIAAAKNKTINPPKEYFQKLVWDKISRLDHWLIDTCGTEDTPYVRTVGAKWMIGAAARVFRPGCKMDNTLILEGDQGIGKSTVFKELATFNDKAYFTDDLAPPGTKDCSIQLQGVIIVELPEMQALIRTDRNVFVPWLSRTSDRYRPPYGIMLVESPRRCIFGGTWNPDNTGLFEDPTGARRYWPVSCKEINLDLIRTCRDQLWAEAIERYKAGEKWWLEGEEAIALAREQQEMRESDDVWGELINECVHGKTRTTINEILHAMHVPIEKRDRKCERRIGHHMRRIGWSRKKMRPSAYKDPTWYFINPDCLNLNPEEF